ncbi:putative pentatricopeptide repeat-containing protein At3g05240 [Elaeis guineensis]|uniref:putative pentatricopeptide repeat-containing protein At3g05240 n=1 Tax=Elaeis guineensis var. tenera TaxID=51953 RepID=UPI003C6D2F09
MPRRGFSPDVCAFALVTRAWAHLNAVETGETVHICCGKITIAGEAFDGMPRRDVVSWTSILSGNAQNGRYKDALTMFQEKACSEVKPDEITIVSALHAFDNMDAECRDLAKQKPSLGKCLKGMLSRGQLEYLAMFKRLAKDAFSWNATVGGFATHGHGREAIYPFDQMQKIGTKA